MTCSLLAFLKQNYLFVVLLLRRKWEMLKDVKTQSIPIDKEWFWRMFYLPSANMYWLHICPLTKKTQLFFSVFLPLNIIVFLSLHSFYRTKGFSIVFASVKFENLWFQNVKLKKKLAVFSLWISMWNAVGGKESSFKALSHRSIVFSLCVY